MAEPRTLDQRLVIAAVLIVPVVRLALVEHGLLCWQVARQFH